MQTMRVGVGIALLVLASAVAGFVATRSRNAENKAGAAFCRAEYSRARTAADTARIDRIVYGMKGRHGLLTCGSLRALR